MTLCAFDLLSTVVSALFSAHRGTLDRLGIHYACTGLGISLRSDPKAFSDSPVDLLPGSVDTPLSEVVIDGGPSLGKS